LLCNSRNPRIGFIYTNGITTNIKCQQLLKVNKNLLFSIDKIWKRGYFNIRKAKTFGNREKQNQNQTKIKNKRRKNNGRKKRQQQQ
jgi:hypothetical protein